MKALLNFLLANLCAVLPLWWVLFGWMPDQIRMYMRGAEAPGSVVAEGTTLVGEDIGTWADGHVFRFYLRKDMKWNALAFRLPGNMGTDGVGRIELQKWKLLAFRKTGRELVPSGDAPNEYIFDSPGFGQIGIAAGKISLGVALLELVALAISWGAARRHRPECWKMLWPPVLGVALALTLLMQVALPVQSYLANRSSYPFSAPELAGAIAVRFVWISILAITAIGLLARCFGRWILGMVFAFAVCVYLESGILSNGLASLNGDIWFFLNPKRALWDAAVWVGVFVVVAAAHAALRKHYGIAALCLMVMVAASMLDVKREKPADKSGLVVDDFVPFGEVIRNVAYSTNVLVFILDSLEREQAHAIMEDPEEGGRLREAFRGFTEYTNNVGALPTTVAAVPNLLTGRYPDETTSIADHAWSCYAEDSAVKAFLEAEHDVFMTTPGLGCGFASKRRTQLDCTERTIPVLQRSGDGGEAWSIMDFTRWRWLPFAAKASCMQLTGLAHSSNEQREWAVFPALGRAGIESGSSGVFLLCHTDGVHVPIKWNRQGEMLAQERYDNQACHEQGVFVLECLAELMDAFRQKGIYDKSLILVLGDHGKHSEEDYLEAEQNGWLPENARPCLWIKSSGSAHEFKASAAPTGHAQISHLLKAAAREVLSDEEIHELLQSDERVYRRMALLGSGWTDWTVQRDGRFSVQTVKPGPADKENARPLKCGRHYTLFWKKTSQIDAELYFEDIAVDGFPSLPKDKQQCAVSFRVPDAGKTYVLHMELYDGEGGHLRFRCETADAEWQVFPVKPFARLEIRNVKADATGMAKVVCERVPGPSVDVAFTGLCLDESP